MKLWLPVVPEPWRRTRGAAGGSRFTDPRHRAYAEEIGYRLRAAIPEPLDGWLSVDLVFESDGIALTVEPFSIPRPASIRADLDNLAKAILDAGNAIAWTDDRQVTELKARFR